MAEGTITLVQFKWLHFKLCSREFSFISDFGWFCHCTYNTTDVDYLIRLTYSDCISHRLLTFLMIWKFEIRFSQIFFPTRMSSGGLQAETKYHLIYHAFSTRKHLLPMLSSDVFRRLGSWLVLVPCRSACVRAGKVKNAERAMQRMINMGIVPNVNVSRCTEGPEFSFSL